jgi:PIN domain nuclease of toxin-antitoxin system
MSKSDTSAATWAANTEDGFRKTTDSAIRKKDAAAVSAASQ